MLGSADVAAFLNGYAALWHPAVIRDAAAPPRVVSPYEHEQPKAGQVFAVPESPPPMQPDDWNERVREAGAFAFRSTTDRATTLARLQEALGDSAWRDVPAEKVAAFMGIGFGFMMVNALYEAMEHENLLSVDDFWKDVREAARALDDGEPNAYRAPLQAAADRLMTAREVLYPVAMYVLDLTPLRPSFPAAFAHGLPVNVVGCTSKLQELQREHPSRFAELRERVGRDSAEVCGVSFIERADELLPLDSQLWNLLHGLATSREMTGVEPKVFARRHFAFPPHAPLTLTSTGITRAILFGLEDNTASGYRSTVVAYASPDGRQIDALARTPYPADDPNTFFHIAHYLHKTIMQDHAATLGLVHRNGDDSPAYADWVELTRFAPVLGQWVTLSRYLGDVSVGEYSNSMSPDEFHADHLSVQVDSQVANPVSRFADHHRRRRRMDTLWTLAAFARGLMGTNDLLRLESDLTRLEERLEQAQADDESLNTIEHRITNVVAGRLLSRAQGIQPGYLVFNPCGYPRRVALKLPGGDAPLAIEGPVKACQLDDGGLRAVVEVPSLGFAWIPKSGPPGTPPMISRMRLADDRHVRNEFFEAEIDPETGGLRGIYEHQTRVSRIGQQLVFNPGSTMKASKTSVVSTGPALGEVLTEGTLVGEHDQVLARFRQRFRAWLGRPLLELRIEIEPLLAPAGYAWHAYYAARFAWRDERATLLRGINGTGFITSHTRPQTPDYLELRQGRQNTVLFPGGLPFHQRHGARMLDVILIPPGEAARSFDLALALDRPNPMLTAQGFITPVPCVEVPDGPPHIGASGWLFHLDTPNLLLTNMRPAPNGDDAVIARLLECGQHGGHAEMRFPRNARQAELRDARGELMRDASVDGDRAAFEVAPGELIHIHAHFGE
jgi:hypothetical protein